MRHSIKLLTVLGFALLGTFLTAATAVAQQQAKIVKLVGKGTATITRNGAEIPVTEGIAVQVGDVINTGAGVDVFVQPYPGVLATLKPNSHAKLEELQGDTAMLDLRGGGNVVAQIEPNKGHKFGVRTPKGVAAAKGTVLNITIAGQDYTVVTMAGAVTVFTGTFGSYDAAVTSVVSGSSNGVLISAGTAFVQNGPSAVAVGADNPRGAAAIQSAAQVAVAAVAQAAASNLQGGGELAQVMQTVVQAVPGSVASVVATAAAVAPTEAASVVKAAVDAATTPAQAVTIAQQASQGAAQGVVQANNGVVDATVTSQITDISKNASQSATQKGGDASTVASTVSSSTATGAGAGVTASGGNLNSGTTATDLAKAAASGSTTGAITGSGSTGTAAQNIANSASSGAVQGVVNSGGNSSNINTSDVGAGAVNGASNAGTNVSQPTVTPPTQTPVVIPQTTPTTPVDPSLTISTSG